MLKIGINYFCYILYDNKVMGHKYSRPVIPVYQKVESMFEDIGCSGFTDTDYYGYDRLDKAPFLNYKIRSVNYAELKQQITDILANLPDALGMNQDTNITQINLGSSNGSGIGSFNILGGINFGYNPNTRDVRDEDATNNYNSKKSYISRIIVLLDHYLNNKIISVEEKNAYLNKLLKLDTSSDSVDNNFQKAIFDLEIPGIQIPYYSTSVKNTSEKNIQNGTNFIDSYTIDNIINKLLKQYGNASGSEKSNIMKNIKKIKNNGQIQENFGISQGINNIIDEIKKSSGSIPYINPSPNGDIVNKVFGPVYLLSAYDLENKVIESWLYFPSLTTDRKLYPNFWFLANSNKWLFRILYSVMYKVKPYSSCNIHQMISSEYDNSASPNYRWYKSLNASFIQGCKSINNDWCKQSESVHRAMGIYDDKKSSDGYPSAYFRTYKINNSDPLFINYFDKRSFNNLLMCFLASDTEIFAGCRYMLVSPNRRFFYILENDSLILYYNLYQNIDILSYCHQGGNPRTYAIKLRIINFNGVTNTKLVFENGYLNIYSQLSDEDPEVVVWSLLIVNEQYANKQCTVVLLDDGNLKVFNNNNKDVTHSNIGKLSSLISDKTKSSTIIGGGSNESTNVYDIYTKENSYKLRLIQLIAYLKIRNMIKSGTITTVDEYINFGNGSIINDTNGNGSSYINSERSTENVYSETYNSKTDYIHRITLLIDKYINTNKMTPSDKEYYLNKILSSERSKTLIDNSGISNDSVNGSVNGSRSDNLLYKSIYGDGEYNYGQASSLGDIITTNSDNNKRYNDGNGIDRTRDGSTLDDNYNDIDNGYNNEKDRINKEREKRDLEEDKILNKEYTILTGMGTSSGVGTGSGSDDRSLTQETSYSTLSKLLGVDINESGIIETSPDTDKSFVMGFNDIDDGYNDILTEEEINYLISNGVFNHITDMRIRIKMLHQYYKKNHKKVYYR